MKLKKIYNKIPLIILLLAFSCTTFRNNSPTDIIKIYLLTNKGSEEDWVTSHGNFSTDKKYYTSKLPLLTSLHIRKIKIIPSKKNKYYLKLLLDRHARFSWMQTSGMYAGLQLLFTLNGQAIDQFRIKKYIDTNSIMIPIAFSKENAERISKSAESNYKYFKKR